MCRHGAPCIPGNFALYKKIATSILRGDEVGRALSSHLAAAPCCLLAAGVRGLGWCACPVPAFCLPSHLTAGSCRPELLCALWAHVWSVPSYERASQEKSEAKIDRGDEKKGEFTPEGFLELRTMLYKARCSLL